MKLALKEEMRQMDIQAIEEYGMPSVSLMENAGVAVARAMIALLGDLRERKLLIFCGKGNNGGDGLVAARHFLNAGAHVSVFLLEKELSGDSAVYAKVLTHMHQELHILRSEQDWVRAKLELTFADGVVDALVGTGFQGRAEGYLARAIELLNNMGKPVVAIDIPSGVEADTGQCQGVAVKAEITVTLALPKPGLFLHPGAGYAGSIFVDDIGMPLPLLAAETLRQALYVKEQAAIDLPARHTDSHKGTYGHVGILAGSKGYTGAAVLCATGALRSGTGLVTLLVGESIRPSVEARLQEVMVRALPDSGCGVPGQEQLEAVRALSLRWKSLAVGPGLGQEEETMALVREFIGNTILPAVVDADGLSAFRGQTELFSCFKQVPILTPHPGELEMLSGFSVSEIQADRLQTVRFFAQEWGVVLVLKGAPTLVGWPDGQVFFNTTGNAGMATAGSGDVLTGVIAGLLAQGLSPQQAAVAGVYLHGAAGDLAAQEGMAGMTAGDLVACLQQVFLKTSQIK